MNRFYALEDLSSDLVRGSTVLMRVDFNVPLAEGRVMDATRLELALPTVQELCERGARLLLASHCGRPRGIRDPRFSLLPVVPELARRLGQGVTFASDCIGEPARQAARDLAPGRVCVLENLRFHPGEEANDGAFAAELASLAPVYVDDAFGTVHRRHASIAALPHAVAMKAAGRLMLREVDALGRLLGQPQRPFVAVLGGAKIGDKIDTLRKLVEKIDVLLLGGMMANTFLVAKGYDLAASRFENAGLDLARAILRKAEEQEVEVCLPLDLVVTKDLEDPAENGTVGIDAVPSGTLAVDIGPLTRSAFRDALLRARTVFWNGPMGVFEKPPFDRGSRELARAVGACSGYTVVGGGETVAIARLSGVERQIRHISTGGGAMLEFLAGKSLPGLVPLEKSIETAGS